MARLPSLRMITTCSLAALALVVTPSCVDDDDDHGASAVELDDDPAAALGDEELWDEGPPADEEAVDDLGAERQPSAAPTFQLPFPCGQVWAGQTRGNHSPVNAIDFNRADDYGDKVVAAAAGTVSRVENEGNVSYGRWIEINHGNGHRTRYAHLSAQNVTVGQAVARGQKIGAVGNSGGSSGAHLHYEQRLDGAAVKPVFGGAAALFFGTKNYTSNNCGGGGGGVAGTVNTAGPALTIRSGPSTGATAVGSVADGAKVTITCQKHGTSVTGTYGTTTLWDFIGTGYVSDAYVSTGSDGQVAPTCP